MVVAEKATEALTPPNGADVMPVSNTVNQVVAETLMMALAMIVRDKLSERPTVCAALLAGVWMFERGQMLTAIVTKPSAAQHSTLVRQRFSRHVHVARPKAEDIECRQTGSSSVRRYGSTRIPWRGWPAVFDVRPAV